MRMGVFWVWFIVGLSEEMLVLEGETVVVIVGIVVVVV